MFNFRLESFECFSVLHDWNPIILGENLYLQIGRKRPTESEEGESSWLKKFEADWNRPKFNRPVKSGHSNWVTQFRWFENSSLRAF